MGVEKYICKEIMAFVPAYLKMKGNCTLIYTKKSGKIEINRTVKTLLKVLSKHFMIDLKISRKHYGNILGIYNLVPIPFNEENIFIPIKIRKPICKNDGALGYFNIGCIEKIEKLENRGVIYLKNNYKIKTLNTIKTINKHLKNGYIVKKLYDNKYCKNDSFYMDYDKPATKGDIAILRNEILSIKEYLT